MYYVMPFVDGESLRDRMNRDKILPIEDALRIASEVATALDFAHRKNIIHRDIKPENILLQEGHALIADFGIARAVNSMNTAALTQTGMSLGTPTYMGPEQAFAEKDIDGRTDEYGLACVLYEMATGAPPFTGPNAQAREVPKAEPSTRKYIIAAAAAAVLLIVSLVAWQLF
ncbi:MAG TPA: serine/threonine-protein kinase [Gemmatimonadaceae bacterium]|nr:serine/threonine-protein kinase [Gemmatimonadaceae bacterium]